jgi:hypothetical protein
MSKSITLDTLRREVETSLLEAIAVAAERALDGYSTERTRQLVDEQLGLEIARGIINLFDLQDATTFDELAAARQEIDICWRTLLLAGLQGQADGVDRLRQRIHRVWEDAAAAHALTPA